MNTTPRTLAMACRCQLLIGSWLGNPYACPCRCPDDCPLTEEQRKALESHPSVGYAQERSCAAYRVRLDRMAPPEQGVPE